MDELVSRYPETQLGLFQSLGGELQGGVIRKWEALRLGIHTNYREHPMWGSVGTSTHKIKRG